MVIIFLLQIILPPTRTIAMVEFVEATEARSAFRGLAYTQFRNVPLYLGMFSPSAFIAASFGFPFLVGFPPFPLSYLCIVYTC